MNVTHLHTLWTLAGYWFALGGLTTIAVVLGVITFQSARREARHAEELR